MRLLRLRGEVGALALRVPPKSLGSVGHHVV